MTDKKSIWLRALKNMKDVYGIQRHAGAEWLIGVEQANSHILDVNEKFMMEVPITSLSSLQYCYVLNPYVNGVRKFGEKELRKGEMKFFLQPGEELESNKIHSVIVLGEDEALVLKAVANYKDEEGKDYLPGTIWMKVGPCDFIPPIEV